MAKYATMAIDAGASIVGGCCGTSPQHLASMRAAIDSYAPGERPTINSIVDAIGPLTNSAPAETAERRTRRSRA
jgi:5-methyltetrahydrofolate--homocysteine methyltransferase